MVEQSAVFAWYELLTTDVSAAQSFYGKVVGWDVQDTSTSEFAYRLFSVGGTPVAGLMELPLDGWKKGRRRDGWAMSRSRMWTGSSISSSVSTARCTCRRRTATSADLTGLLR
jgi:hypothetical protein